MSSQVLVGLLGLLAVILGGLFARERTKLQDEQGRRQQVQEQLSEKKREAYSSVNEVLTKLFAYPKILEKLGSTKRMAKYMDEMTDALIEARQRVWTFGSPEVIRADSALQQVSLRPQGNAIVVLAAELILAMREDMGLSNDGITALDMLRVFPTDADETYDEARAAAEEFKEKLRTRTDIPALLRDEPDRPQR